MTCFTWIFILAGLVFATLTLVRLLEQTADAVDHRWWNRLALLILCPFTVWFFPGRVSAGRPTPVPRHEPARGFGSLPKQKPPTPTPPLAPAAPPAPTPPPRTSTPDDDQPPPGTPPEFLVKPQIPPKKSKPATAPDPDKIAKLKQKMRDQGMIE